MALELDPDYPVRVTSAGQDHHPAAVETTRGLLALVYETGSEVWRTYSLDRGETWADPQKFVSGSGDYQPRARYNHRGGFALVWSGESGERDVYFEEILEVQNVSDNLIQARIKRSRDSASKGADVEIASPGDPGLYDPEVPRTRWSGVFLPGARIEVMAGYGGELVTRFSGFLDSVGIDDETPTLSLSARGEFKYLLDQSVGRTLRYQNKKRVAIIAELAVEAGMDPLGIQIQDSDQRVTEEHDREKSYASIIQSQADALSFDLYEPDAGGLICREPAASTSPSWFYEEEQSMYSREREFDDDEVYTTVEVYREDKRDSDGNLELAGFTVRRVVDTEILTPPGKVRYEEVEDDVSEAQAAVIADTLAARIGREGKTIQIATPLNVAQELTDPVSIRRKSIEQEGVYVVEEYDDDMTQDGFVGVLQARRIG